VSNHITPDNSTKSWSSGDQRVDLRCIRRPTGLPWLVSAALGASLCLGLVLLALWIAPYLPEEDEHSWLDRTFLAVVGVSAGTCGFIGGAFVRRFGWLFVIGFGSFVFGLGLLGIESALFNESHYYTLAGIHVASRIWQTGQPNPAYDRDEQVISNLRRHAAICLVATALSMAAAWLLACIASISVSYWREEKYRATALVGDQLRSGNLPQEWPHDEQSPR
jgi:hypothetical protein